MPHRWLAVGFSDYAGGVWKVVLLIVHAFGWIVCEAHNVQVMQPTTSQRNMRINIIDESYFGQYEMKIFYLN